MATQARFTINGVIDTSQTALQNLEQICNSCGAWLTFDNYSGRWSVVINQPGTSVKSFDHSNIIGGIRLNGTGLEDLYNAVKVTYPLNDIQNNTDFIEIALPESEWNPNEVKNVLDISLPLVNNQVQARLIGFRDLKQNRVNQIIQFETDYSSIGLKAGDIITVTSAPLGLAAALYRISEIREQDSAELGITLTITAILYSAEVYNENNLSEYVLTTENGIITAGDIGTPLQPTVTTYQQAARPRLVIDTVVPSGVISAMEFWLAVGSPSAVYTLVGTETNTSGVYLTEGSTVTLDISNQNTGNVYVKTRAVNRTTAGAFSPVSALIPFVPVQVTDAINPNTKMLAGNGSPIASQLALTALLKGLDTYMKGDSNLGNAVGNQISSSSSGSILYNYMDAGIFFNSGNSQSGSTNPSIPIWYVGPSFTFTVPNNTRVFFQLEVNGGANESWYASNYPVNTTKIIEIYKNGLRFANTSTNSDPFDDLSLQAIDDVVTGGPQTYTIQMAVEEIGADILGLKLSFIAFGIPL